MKGNDIIRQKERMETRLVKEIDRGSRRKRMKANQWGDDFDISFAARVVFQQPAVAFQLIQFAGAGL